MKRFFLFLFLCALSAPGQSRAAEAKDPYRPLPYMGVNMPEAASAGNILPGVYSRNYIYPAKANIDMYADLGVTVVRIAFLWERMQPTLNAPLDGEELARLDAVVSAAARRKVMVLLDPHNFGSYRKVAIGAEDAPIEAFADFWSRLAAHYKENPSVIFGLMNEPFKQKAAEWSPIAQEAINAIRKTGATQLILVPGTRYSGARTWLAKDGDLSNAEALRNIKDPGNNFAFEFHQYFDSNFSGTHEACISPDIGAKALSGVTAWLRETGHKGFLGEFGVSKDPVCLQTLENTLRAMSENADVWLGWTYWAASPWFANYMYNIYPPDASRYPQVDVLKKFWRPRIEKE